MNKGIFLNLPQFAQAFFLSWMSLWIIECIFKFQDVQFLFYPLVGGVR